MMLTKILPVLLAVIFINCSSHKNVQEQSLTQYSTIDALLQGVYDGNLSLTDLKKKGNFGIGTFNGLDGEMVLVDGKCYQVKADGKVYEPNDDSKTPFTTVTHFECEQSYPISKLNFDMFKHEVDSLMQTTNQFFAIHLKGKFDYVKTRSVPAQSKPYPPLAEVTKNQPEFEAKDVNGQIVGFYCPQFVKGINVPEYHLHFLSEDKNFGGHLLAFNLTEGNLTIDKINHFEMILPDEGDFLSSEFKTDRSEELKKVEQ